MLGRFGVGTAIAADSSGEYSIEDFYVPATGYPLSNSSGIYWKDMNYFSVKKTNNSAQFRVWCEYVVDKSFAPQEWLSCDIILNDDLDADYIKTADELGDDYNDRVKSYEKMAQGLRNPYYDIVEKTFDGGSQKYTIIAKETADFGDEKIIYHHGTRAFIYGNHYCGIYCELKTNNPQDVKGKLDLIEARIMEIMRGIQPAKKTMIAIDHYHPLSKDSLDHPAQYPPGELIVTLRDGENKGIAGKKVYLFVEETEPRMYNPYSKQMERTEILKFDPSPIVFNNLYLLGTVVPGNMSDTAVPFWDIGDGQHVVVTTNANGVARYNYLDHFNLRFYNLESYVKRDGSATARVWAVMFDRDPEELYRQGKFFGKNAVNVTYYNVTEVRYDSVAAIRDIGAEPGAERKVRVMKTGPDGSPVGSKGVTLADLPYQLMPGDVILMDEDDRVDVSWVTGLNFIVKVKPGYIDAEHPLARVWIGSQDMGWYQLLSQQYKDPSAAVYSIVGDGVWWALDLPHPAEAVVATAAFFLSIGWYYGDKIASPVVLVPRSTLVVDFNDGEMIVRTVEGIVTVINRNNESVDVPAGTRVNATDAGGLSPVMPFQPGELSSEQREALEDLMQSAATPGPTAAGGDIDDYDDLEEAGEGLFCCPCCPFALLPLLLVLVAARSRRPKP
jgi:hypothetical protein